MGRYDSGGVSRVMVFIDGGYVRSAFLEKFNTDNLNYYNFAQLLTKHTASGTIFSPNLERAYYYDGMPSLDDLDNFKHEPISQQQQRKQKIEQKIQVQQQYLNKIRLADFFDVKQGRLVMDSNGDFRQKGVDSLIAVDMVSKAYQRQFDEAVLVTADSDFIEVIEAVKLAGPRVTGAYFQDHVTPKLAHSFDRRIDLTQYNMQGNKIIP